MENFGIIMAIVNLIIGAFFIGLQIKIVGSFKGWITNPIGICYLAFMIATTTLLIATIR